MTGKWIDKGKEVHVRHKQVTELPYELVSVHYCRIASPRSTYLEGEGIKQDVKRTLNVDHDENVEHEKQVDIRCG